MEAREQLLEFRLKFRTAQLNTQRVYFMNAVNQLSHLLRKSPSLIKNEIMEEEEDTLVRLGIMPIPETHKFDDATNSIINIMSKEIYNKTFYANETEFDITYKGEKFDTNIVKEFFKGYKYKISFRGHFSKQVIIHIIKEEK